MSSWSKRILGAALFLAFAVQLGCEYTGSVKAVRAKGFYCKTGSKCTRGYEEHEVCYFACKEDAEAAGYTCCPKHAKKMKPEKKEKKAKAKEEISSCATCPMRDTCDKKPGFYTGPVIGIKSQKIYTKKGCPCLKDVKKEDMVEFKCKKEAAEAGYKPCPECPCFKDEPAAKPAEVKPAATPPPQPAAQKVEPAKPAPAPTKPPETKPAAAPAPQPQPAAQPAPAKKDATAAPAPPKKEEAKPAPAPGKKETQPALPPAKKEEKQKT